jgi:MFS superfamily sulfate permease-like transporter
MNFKNRKARFLFLSFLHHDFRASITVFFVALPLCLGIALASNAPVYSGLIAGIIGGLVITLISKSELSVSGPAAGLTAICAAAITQLGSLEVFFLAVSLAGLFQVLLGILRLGGFTHFIPSAVIKGMLAAIGIILISKQIPLLIGYNRPDFWRNELFNIITLDHGFSAIKSLYKSTSTGAVLIAIFSLLLLIIWRRTLSGRITFLPTSFITVLFGVLLAVVLKNYFPSFALKPSQYISLPENVFADIRLPCYQ